MLDNVLFLMPHDTVLTAPLIIGALLREMDVEGEHSIDAAFSADAEGAMKAVAAYMADNVLDVLVKLSGETIGSEDQTISGHSVRVITLPSANSPTWLAPEAFQSAVRLLEGALLVGDPRWN